jgi:hypothetical protein
MTMLKNSLPFFFLFTITACTQAKNVDPQVYQCIANNPEYSERCKLQAVKEKYEKKEVAYYFEQVGKRKFEKEMRRYVDDYIKNAELYCGMNTSFSFVDIPSDKNKIYEKTAECLMSQYIQLGSNLRSMTNTATKTIIERVSR